MKKISYNKFVRNTILLSLLLIISIFTMYGFYFKSSSIQKSIKNDTQVIADLIFQNLYTVMKNGGDMSSIDETIFHLEKNIPHINIKIIKEQDEANTDMINEAFITKEPVISRRDNFLDFSSPILYKNECLKCHMDSNINEVAGVVHIEHPILDLKITLKEILLMATVLFLITIVVFFSTWYHFLNKYFVKPILNLTTQIDNNLGHHGLNKEISIDTRIREIKRLEDSFNKQNRELMDSYQTIVEQSNTDPLTQIFNRKKFDEYSLVFFNDAKRSNHIFSLVLIDLNKFKPINDTYGHDAGDKVLVFFSSLISHMIRASDFFFRTGGDEFILLLPNTCENETKVVIDKIKDRLKEELFVFEDIEIELSASFGICEYTESYEDINSMVKIADKKMYEDKKNYSKTL